MTSQEKPPEHSYSANRVSEDIRLASPSWLESYDPNLLVLFTHVPKAGGTGLKQALTKAYGRTFTDHHPTLNNVVDQVTAGERDPAGILALSSHLPYGFHRRIPGLEHRKVLPFTVVREPMARMISYYNFVTTFRPHRHHEETKDLGVNEFFAYLMSLEVGEIENGQCRLISGSTDRTYEAALDRLESEYFAFGPLDEHSKMLDLLRSNLGWPVEAAESSGPTNASPRRAGIDDLSDEIAGALRKRNSEDLRLYDELRRRGACVQTHLLG